DNGVDNVTSSATIDAAFRQRSTSGWLSLARPLGKSLRLRGTYGLRHTGFRRAPWNDPPGFALPDPFLEHVAEIDLDFSRRRLYAHAELETRQRETAETWGIEGSQQVTRAPGRLLLSGGYSLNLPRHRSFGARIVFERGWQLDHFSDLFTGFAGVRAPGFQPKRFDTGWGGSVSYSRNIRRRVPLTLRLGAALTRHDRFPDNDANQMGLEIETFFNGWWKTDIFLRVGLGLYSNRPGEAGDLRSRLIVSRRF
ncbi:MAG: hypothetical protein AAF657_40340, partial [Acidobacteriota bacterium]